MEKLEKWYKNWKTIVAILTSIVAIFMFSHKLLNSIDDLNKITKTTQQMSLKSVIWNDNIPITERASACDVYLSAGYNSMTKKECEKIIDKGVSDGIFSYVERKVNKNDTRINIWGSTSFSYSNIGFVY